MTVYVCKRCGKFFNKDLEKCPFCGTKIGNRDSNPGVPNPYLTEIKEILESIQEDLDYLKRFLSGYGSERQ